MAPGTRRLKNHSKAESRNGTGTSSDRPANVASAYRLQLKAVAAGLGRAGREVMRTIVLNIRLPFSLGHRYIRANAGRGETNGNRGQVQRARPGHVGPPAGAARAGRLRPAR